MKAITEDYVSRETYKLLKEKGYDCEIKTCYDTEGYTCPAIHLYDAMKWLMVTYGYYIWVDYSRFDFDKNQPFLWNIVKAEIDGDYYGGTYHKTYEQACEAAIRYCLENLI